MAKPFRVDNPWFAGETEIPTFSNEELLATKLRALLQRNKGRDLVDLAHAREVFPELVASYSTLYRQFRTRQRDWKRSRSRAS